jgi:hypothetical protein
MDALGFWAMKESNLSRCSGRSRSSAEIMTMRSARAFRTAVL